jgi:riboflavin-specific deaminase-like protein
MAQMTATERDARHLQRTLELAARARGHTSPNPLVGAVIVKDGRSIGEGFHAAAGEPHAERQALAACSEDPSGATLYVSLEPCCHHGRTPPCTDAIVEAVARQPRRVIFDSEARLPVDSKLVRGVAEAPLTVVVSRAASRTAVQGLEAAGCDVVLASGGNEPARVASALDELGALGIQSLLLEGGPRLAGSFLEAGEVDEARFFVAPLLAGGRDARTAVEGTGVEQIAGADRAIALDVERIEDDVLISARFMEW